jgi:spore germination cell wall hydrolase CwlJ-like protein
MSYTVVLPDGVKPLTDVFMLALAIYREARGETAAAKVAVGWVIRNRVEHPAWYGNDYSSVITKREQLSSFNLGEVNSVVFGAPSDPAWHGSLQAAVDVIQSNAPDPTGGATFYFDKSMDSNPPVWAKEYAHTADIGAFHFYKPKS